MVDNVHRWDGWLGYGNVGVSTLDRIIIGEGIHMEAVKWNLDVVDKITIYTDSKEIVYRRKEEKWHGAGVSIGTKTMKILMEKYEKAGCIVVPETSIYIPTDTYAIEVGTWEVSEDNGKWEFDRGYLFLRKNDGWHRNVTIMTNMGVLGFLRRRLDDDKAIKFLNKNLDCIGYID